MRFSFDHRPIDWVVDVHVEDAAVIASQLIRLRLAPHMGLAYLTRFETRLRAHLDGILEAGRAGRTALERLMADEPDAGAFCVAVTCALEEGDEAFLREVLDVVRLSTLTQKAAGAGLAWVDADRLRGVAARLALSDHPLDRLIAIDACRTHLTRAEVLLRRAVEDDDSAVAAFAMRVAGMLGLVDLVASTPADARDPPLKFARDWAAGIAMGERNAVGRWCVDPGPWRTEALGLSLRSAPIETARATLATISREAAPRAMPATRLLISGAGIVGDPFYIPWLVVQMSDPKLTRLAGESFSMITGLDLAYLDLDRKPPENFESGPNDDPNDPNVDMDEDDGLPWPDQEKIAAWWKANSHRFPAGQRFFMGQPPSMAHCLEVLKSGYQRQRMAAAIWRCILQPGTPLFPTDAPAWRQKRWLAQMTA